MIANPRDHEWRRGVLAAKGLETRGRRLEDISSSHAVEERILGPTAVREDS